MTPIASLPVDHAFWPQVADAVMRWLAGQGAEPRDAIVLLPHVGLVGPARAAFAGRGGWQPRIETAATLATAQSPPAPAAAGMLCGDRVADRLAAMALLANVSLATSHTRDAREFHALVAAFVETAHALHAASARQLPAARAAWWDDLRDALPPTTGPGATERRLARMALEWAAAAEAPHSDALQALRPAAWVVVRAGGIDDAALLPADGVPRLQLDADGDAARPFAAAARLPPPRWLTAPGLEDEAAAAAQAVVEALDAGAVSVALIAQDRLVVRRIRALLERLGVALDDETGWTLSTTRAAARLMAWLRAAMPHARRDDCIEALRAQGAARAAVDALEAAWRGQREPGTVAQSAEDDRLRRVAAWAPERPRTLAQWLRSLREAAPGLIGALAADAAGRQVIDLLGLTQDPDLPWDDAAQALRLDLAQFIAWIDDALEGSAWRPTPAAAARVRIVPLARAVLRPFDAIVFPGCDARHLGAADAAAAWLPVTVSQAFGVADAARRRREQTLAFAQLLRAPQVTLLSRLHDAGEALAPSPLLERALLARRRMGAIVPPAQAATLPSRRVPLQPVARPAPAMRDAMPQRLSATKVQALRDCPYRFFARVALGLAEADELDVALDKSDYGRWMHGLLDRFHAQRSRSDDLGELVAAADAEQAALGLDAAALWPYRAAFDRFATHYLAWLQDHEAQGWRFAAGEVARERAPAALGGLVLEGRLDRIDTDAVGATLLIDYKTGQRDKLRQRVQEPLEDTQLAFYAALLADDASAAAATRAIYLVLSERDAPEAFEHRDVAASAALLVEGLAADLHALREGSGAPALGEGDVCRHCEARGLCRRDHWSAGA
jgi:ATP-dependent helicase/nuclease subunit B